VPVALGLGKLVCMPGCVRVWPQFVKNDALLIWSRVKVAAQALLAWRNEYTNQHQKHLQWHLHVATSPSHSPHSTFIYSWARAKNGFVYTCLFIKLSVFELQKLIGDENFAPHGF